MDNKLFRVDEIEAINFDENGKEDGTWNGYSVVKIGDEANYCFDCRDKLNADRLCDFLNTEIILDDDFAIDAFVIDNCIEWGNIISTLATKEAELNNIKALYEDQEFSILYGSNIDFKKLYGAANDKTRKHHVQVELADLIEQKEELEIEVNYLKRRSNFLRGLVEAKTATLEVKGND